ncbi:non-ribosomal peptide synthetase [Paenibacillus daejeonensis]|uniref:non-ribosomal peptide synthetase n=1 Tax=Paenibacillus daejeonensis TaxID=135193 RepID=UPI000382BB19|nr:non-ribosomal peptide synthetase [Paenibacillus daejeonensis]
MTIATAGALLPLTHPQKRIWYIEQLYPGTTIHHICGTARMPGPVDEERLSRAVELVLRRHASLRIRLTMKDGEVFQTIHPPVPPHIPTFDCRHSRYPEQALQDWLDQAIRQPFELLSSELFQFAIFRTGRGETGLLVKIHHLIFDGWSTQLFTQALSSCYAELADSEAEAGGLPEMTDMTYIELLDKEQAYLASPRMERDRNYWLEQFQEVPSLPFRDSPDWRKGGRWSMELPAELAVRTLKWTQEAGTSLHELFGLVLQLGMHSTYEVDELTLGVPVYNRSTREEKAAIGMYVSTMPMRCNVSLEASAMQQLKQLRRQFKRGYLHQKYPYDLLVRQLRDRLPEGEGLFQVCLNTYIFNPHEQLGDSPLLSEELYKGEQLYPLELIVKNWGEGQIRLDLDYKLSLFTRKQIASFGLQLVALLEQVLEQPNAPLHVLMEEADKRIDESSQSPAHRTVIESLIASAEQAPSRIALRDGERMLTYSQLLQQIQAMADWLVAHGVSRGDRVALYSEHRLESVIATWAVLWLGAAYVPMDVRHPAGRIADVLSDSECVVIVADRELPEEAMRTISASVLRVDEWCSPSRATNTAHFKVLAQPEDLAYLIYTSGSTGKPKGVMVEHGSLHAYATWATERYLRDESDIFALYSSPAFDLTVTSMFAPLVAGAGIAIYRQPSDTASVLPAILAEARATVIKLTPAHLALLSEAPPVRTPVHTLIVGGEALHASLAKSASEALGGPRVYNEYGPTEATVGCMIHLFDSRSDQEVDVPIGEAAAHARLYLIDVDGKQPAIGSPGELCVAGTGVARGYRGRAELTAERFVPEPGYPNSRMYRTGDLALLDHNGVYRYLGRIDDQIKLSGYRIEPGEIERQLQRQPGVKEAAVVSVGLAGGSPTLLAFVTGVAGMQEDVLRQQLGEQLPAYMVPARIIRLEALPLTPSGKVDRRTLVEREVTLGKHAQGTLYPGHRSTEATGSSGLETLLTLARALLRNDSLGEQDDFYREGGDSIKAIQLSSRLQEAGWLLQPSDVLEAASFAAMAERMTAASSAPGDSLPVEGRLGLPPIGAWFVQREFPIPQYWNQSVLLRLDTQVTPVMAEEALTRLVRHHDALRLNVDRSDEGTIVGLRYNPEHLQRRFIMSRHDLSAVSGGELDVAIREAAIRCKRSFDLDQGLLFAACWLELGERGRRLLLTAHHLVVDAVSWLILTSDLEQLLEAMRQGSRPELPAKSDSYADWSGALETRAAALGPRDISYWEEWQSVQTASGEPASRRVAKKESNGGPALQMTPRDIEVAMGPVDGEAWLETPETALWLGEANRPYRTEPTELLLAALAGALLNKSNGLTGKTLVIQMERHGREPLPGAQDLTRTVGWFTTLYPLPLLCSELQGLSLANVELDVNQQHQMEQAIVHVKERIRSVPRQGIDYGIARYLRDNEAFARQPEPGVMFNYLGELSTGGAGKLLELADEATGPDSHPGNGAACDIEALAWTVSGRLYLKVRVDQGVSADASALAANWREQLHQVLEHCTRAKEGRFTKTDFETVELSQDELEGLFHE